MLKPTDKYKNCNHHHELTEDHEVVTINSCTFVANKAAIPLLEALGDVGLKTRTHHYDGGDHGFVSILLTKGVRFEVKEVNEVDSTRDQFNGMCELLISW